MTITIQLHTEEELKLLQPLLQLLQKTNAQVQIQDATPTAASDDKMEVKEYPSPEKKDVHFTVLHVADKSFKFNREEANER